MITYRVHLECHGNLGKDDFNLGMCSLYLFFAHGARKVYPRKCGAPVSFAAEDENSVFVHQDHILSRAAIFLRTREVESERAFPETNFLLGVF